MKTFSIALVVLLLIFGGYSNKVEAATPIEQAKKPTLKEVARLAKAGDAKAQYNLGVMYRLGYGIPKNPIKAMEWYQKAAAQGIPEAQYSLGLMYKNGDGVEKNIVFAYAWFVLAVEQGFGAAKRDRDLSEAQLTPAQHSDSERLAASLKKGDILRD